MCGLRPIGLAALAAFAACAPERPTSEPAPQSEPPPRAGALALIYTDASGARHIGREGQYRVDAFCGQQTNAVVNVVAHNEGDGPMTLSRVEWLDGLPVRIGNGGPEDAPLSMMFEPGRVLQPLEAFPLPVAFEPRPDFFEGSATLALHSDDAVPGSVRFTITAQQYFPVCEAPKVIDFGNVALGFGHTMVIPIFNPTDSPMRVSVGDPQSSSGDHLAFPFAPASPRGEFDVAPQSLVEVGIEFWPTVEKTYLAFARVRYGTCCPREHVVQFTGMGVAEVLEWAPAEIDCGEVPVGTEMLRELEVTNTGNVPISLLDLDQVGDAEFRVVAPEVVIVPEKGGIATLTIGCTPASEGLREATLVIPTTAPAPTQLDIPVRMVGVAP